jgi:RNA methyltransferase, TrmH family
MLENQRSPRVRAVAKLAKKAARAESGLFLLEGPPAVAEALTFRPQVVVELFATPSALERHPDIAETAVDAGVDVEFVTEEVLDSMADTVTPQGFVAVCHQFPTAVKDVFAASPKLVAILEEVRDPGNAGTIVRAADAAGADAVVFTGRTVDLYNPKVVRSSTGSLFHLPVAVGAELQDVLQRARAAGLTVLAADVKGEDLLTARSEGVRERGPGAARRAARPRRSSRHGADLRARRVDEPRDRGIRLSLRERLRAAQRASRIGNPLRRSLARGICAP